MKPSSTNDRLKVTEAIQASVIVSGAVVAIAVGFTILALWKAGEGLLTPFRRRR